MKNQSTLSGEFTFPVLFMMLFVIAGMFSCTSEPPEFKEYQRVLTEKFASYAVAPENFKYNEEGDLEIYYKEGSRDIIQYNILRTAAILLTDNDPALFAKERIVFKFGTPGGEYYDMPYETFKLNQEYTRSLSFEAPERFLGNKDRAAVIAALGDSAGKGNSDGVSKTYYFLEAGFAYQEGDAIKFFARGAKGANQYEGALPLGLKFHMSKDAVKALLGEPENDSEVSLKYDSNRVSIFFMENKIYFIELFDEEFANMLREKYPDQMGG